MLGKKLKDTSMMATTTESTPAKDFTKIYTQARRAEEEIKSLTLDQRILFIDKLQKVLIKKQDKVIEFLQKETFKSPTDIMTSEIYGPIDFLEYLKKNVKNNLKDKKVPTPMALMGKKSMIIKEPVGTVLLIAPWNYPFFQAVVQSALSFICGNATIYKPSEVTPLKGLVEEVFSEAGFHPHWVQIVYGDADVGRKLIDGRPDKIFFTGSVEAGKEIMARASRNLIPVELELGGKDPMIVFDDADIHRTTSGALWGGLIASGQSCTSVERLMVHEKIYPAFKEMLVKKAKKIRVAFKADPEVEIGPMVTKEQVMVVRNHVEDALAKGAKLLTGENWDRKSNEIPPIILEGVTRDMLVYDEETFGPVIPIYSFKNEEEAIKMANDSQFGLSVSIWSKDLDRCMRIAKKIKTGNVSINNVMLTEGNANLPFGGTKNSGFGRYKGYMGFEAFSNSKSILIDKNSSKVESQWFPFGKEKHFHFKKLIAGVYETRGIKGFFQFIYHGLMLERVANKMSKKD
jgi:acyl-CoA reductase-like NAD-dependent aldehyde dehydrogenase